MLVRRVNPTSAVAEQLQPDDVLLSFDGQDIACDGTVPFRSAMLQRFGPMLLMSCCTVSVLASFVSSVFMIASACPAGRDFCMLLMSRCHKVPASACPRIIHLQQLFQVTDAQTCAAGLVSVSATHT